MKISSKVVETEVSIPGVAQFLPCREIKLYKNVVRATGKRIILFPIKIEALGRKVFRAEEYNGDSYYVLSKFGMSFGLEQDGFICRLVEGELVKGNVVRVYSLLSYPNRRGKTYMRLAIDKVQPTEDLNYYVVYGENDYYDWKWQPFRGYVYAP